MFRRLHLLWYAPMLFVGIALGVAFDSWHSHAEVHADADAKPIAQAAAPALMDTSRQMARVASAVMPAVVHIESRRAVPNRGMMEETGSGIIVGNAKVPGCFVVTNRHVLSDSEDMAGVSIRFFDGRVYHPTRQWIDRETDLAVLRIEADNAPVANFADSDHLEIGNIVLAVGSPFGLRQSVTMGIVSARGRALHLPTKTDLVNQDFIQTDAAINPGNSGGPLVDLEGKVVGINTAIASNSGGNDGIGFSIPSNLVRRVVSELLERGQVRRAYLGVMLDPDFTADKAKSLKLDRLHGTRVAQVYPKSPAQKADLRVDDVVVSFEGVSVIDENHLINLVSLTEIGRTVVLGVIRDGHKINVNVLLSNREELEDRSEAPRRPGMGTYVAPLGLSLHELTPQLSSQLGFARNTRGVLVLRVDAGSPLSANIQLYDLIEEVAATPVASVADVQRLVAGQPSGSDVLLQLKRRSGRSHTSRAVVWRP